MPQFDFKRPMTFINALEQYSLALDCVMIALRNEAQFHDAGDHAVSDAAAVFVTLLEDTLQEARPLSHQLERRVLGMIELGKGNLGKGDLGKGDED